MIFFRRNIMTKLYLRETEESQSPAVHGLLEEVLVTDWGVVSPKLETGPYGKPFLTAGPHFSLSHSHGAVAAAVSDRPVGADLERIRAFPEKLPGRVLSPGEQKWFTARGELKRDFFTLWTLKESFLKYLGTGLRGFPNDTEFYEAAGRWRLRGSELKFSVFLEKDFLAAVCGEEEMVTLHRL